MKSILSFRLGSHYITMSCIAVLHTSNPVHAVTEQLIEY